MTDYGISTQQLLCLDALSSGATMSDAAEQAGVHRNTIANWRRNCLPFQYSLAHAQYDRALLFREKTEALADLAFQTLQAILTDPKAPSGVRLKAALAIIETASTPPPPKKQVVLDIEKINVVHNPEPQILDSQPPAPQNVHKDAQPAPSPTEPPNVHNSAQPTQAQRTDPRKIGRNEACPCGSGQKYKRCCLNQRLAEPRAAAA